MIVGHTNSPYLAGKDNTYTTFRNDSYDPTSSINSFSYDIMVAVCEIQVTNQLNSLTIKKNGTIVQANLFGTQFSEFGYSVYSDGTSGILVAGETNGNKFSVLTFSYCLPANFSMGTSNTIEQSRDMLLLRVFENGTLDWAQQVGTNVTDILYGVTVDLLGSVFGVGVTMGDLNSNANQGLHDVAVMKWLVN